MKIIKQIDENTFVISLTDFDRKAQRGEKIQIAHDYVRFRGQTGLYTDMQAMRANGQEYVTGKHAWAANAIMIPVDVTIGIKSMQNVVMSLLQKHKYMQPEHLADREHTEDDTNWNKDYQNGEFTKPRWKKGDKYPAYSYGNEIIHYYDDENKVSMVAFSREGEKAFSHVTLKLFNEFILPNLNK